MSLRARVDPRAPLYKGKMRHLRSYRFFSGKPNFVYDIMTSFLLLFFFFLLLRMGRYFDHERKEAQECGGSTPNDGRKPPSENWDRLLKNGPTGCDTLSKQNREQTKEIGILRALGLTNFEITKIYVYESCLLARKLKNRLRN